MGPKKESSSLILTKAEKKIKMIEIIKMQNIDHYSQILNHSKNEKKAKKKISTQISQKIKVTTTRRLWGLFVRVNSIVPKTLKLTRNLPSLRF